MISRIAKLLLTSTAIAPVGFVYAWIAYSQNKPVLTFFLSVGCVLLVVLCQIILQHAQKHLERLDFVPTSVEAADRENTAFILLYLLPLFTAQFDTLNWEIWIPALIIFIVVVSTGYGYHFNPLLGLMGWHFYKLGTEEGVTYVLITKKELRSAKQRLTIGQLTEYMVLDLEDK